MKRWSTENSNSDGEKSADHLTEWVEKLMKETRGGKKLVGPTNGAAQDSYKK